MVRAKAKGACTTKTQAGAQQQKSPHVGATGRSQADAPEIDGNVLLRNVPDTLAVGDIVMAEVEDADAHDLFGVIT